MVRYLWLLGSLHRPGLPALGFDQAKDLEGALALAQKLLLEPQDDQRPRPPETGEAVVGQIIVPRERAAPLPRQRPLIPGEVNDLRRAARDLERRRQRPRDAVRKVGPHEDPRLAPRRQVGHLEPPLDKAVFRILRRADVPAGERAPGFARQLAKLDVVGDAEVLTGLGQPLALLAPDPDLPVVADDDELLPAIPVQVHQGEGVELETAGKLPGRVRDVGRAVRDVTPDRILKGFMLSQGLRQQDAFWMAGVSDDAEIEGNILPDRDQTLALEFEDKGPEVDQVDPTGARPLVHVSDKDLGPAVSINIGRIDQQEVRALRLRVPAA